MNRKQDEQSVIPLLSGQLQRLPGLCRLACLGTLYQAFSLAHSLILGGDHFYCVCCGCPLSIANIFEMAAAQLDLVQAYFQDKFHRYRNGRRGVNDTLRLINTRADAGDAAAIRRRNNINARRGTLPRPGNFQFNFWQRDRIRAIAFNKRKPFRDETPNAMRNPGADAQEAGKEQLNNFRNLLRTTFRYIKCLGAGTDGVLTLWRYQPSRGQTHHVVMKQSARGHRLPGARPTLDVERILREKDMTTVSTIPNLESYLFIHLGMLTNPRLSDAVPSAPHCTTFLHARTPSRRPCDPW